MSAPSANDLYRAAQVLAREGQPIFPCYSKGERVKRPLTKNGVKDATTDRTRIKTWWRRHGDAAIGLATGVVWDVLDVDVKDGRDGRVHLPYLNRIGLLNGCKKVVRTPSGGWHLYFRASPTMTNRQASASLGLDVRAKGGYVLAPPSFTASEDAQGSYEDLGETVGSSDEPLLWDLIVSAIQPVNDETRKPIEIPSVSNRGSLASLRHWVSQLQSGERNRGLFWAVCRCIDNGFDPHELVEAAVLTGLTEEEILRTIESALRREGVKASDLVSEAEALFE